MALALALFICFGSGAALVSAASPRGFASALFRLSLSIGFGIGICFITFFVCRVLGTAKLFAADLVVLALLLFIAFLRIREKAAIVFPPAQDPCWPRWLRTIIIAALSIAVCAAVYHAVVRAIVYPHGQGWDAFAIWNLHARFLFRGGDNWRDGFTASIPWSHPDYPLLVPAAIAHFWSYLGRETPLVPSLVGLLFTFSTVGLLFSSLAILRGRIAAMLGSLALVSTPFFIEQGTSQYADVPLGFFFLASLALLSIHDARSGNDADLDPGLLVLSGLAAGFAAWTKNEGLLFLCALILGHFIANLWTHTTGSTQTQRDHRGWRGLAIVAASVLPALILIFCFKHFIVPQGDIFASSNGILPKILAPGRYGAIGKWYVKGFFRFGHWLAVPGTVLLLVFYLFSGRKAARAAQPGFRTCVLTLAFTLAGYFMIYVITPHEIYWHLRFSLDRLFLQLWPSTLLLFFLRIPWSPMPAEQEPIPQSQTCP
jgi:hypothetical protein